MRAILSILKIRTLHGLQYRTAALAGMATQFVWGGLLLMVFSAFRSQNPEAAGLDAWQLASYVWLLQSFLAFVMFWFRDNELFELITSGNLAYEFCRPLDLYGAWFARLAAQRISAAVLRSLPILVFAWFLPSPWGLLPPASITAFFLFLVTLALGLGVMVAISQFIYIGTIVTQTPMALLLVVGTVGEFCSGLIVPLPFLPSGLRDALMWLPFRLTADLPFRTWSGALATSEVLAGIGAQVVWLVILVALGRALLTRIGRRLVVQGG